MRRYEQKVLRLRISIHAPREGSDIVSRFSHNRNARFLSTLPARGATRATMPRLVRMLYFYPRSPRGERRPLGCHGFCNAGFLSTLPARGATKLHGGRPQRQRGFLSTLPARGATASLVLVYVGR